MAIFELTACRSSQLASHNTLRLTVSAPHSGAHTHANPPVVPRLHVPKR